MRAAAEETYWPAVTRGTHRAWYIGGTSMVVDSSTVRTILLSARYSHRSFYHVV